MSSKFLNSADDVQWLKDTHLAGVAIPAPWPDFQSFLLYGNEDAPEKVELFLDDDPDIGDRYLRVTFEEDSAVLEVRTDSKPVED